MVRFHASVPFLLGPCAQQNPCQQRRHCLLHALKILWPPAAAQALCFRQMHGLFKALDICGIAQDDGLFPVAADDVRIAAAVFAPASVHQDPAHELGIELFRAAWGDAGAHAAVVDAVAAVGLPQTAQARELEEQDGVRLLHAPGHVHPHVVAVDDPVRLSHERPEIREHFTLRALLPAGLEVDGIQVQQRNLVDIRQMRRQRRLA